jgi:hypothetical protein
MSKPMPDPKTVTVREWYQELGRRGGKIGGKVVQEQRTPEQRSEHARMMVRARILKEAERNKTVTVVGD